MKKTVLLLGDITGRSRVALRMLTAVLEDAGHEVLMLPTALISNTLNLGLHESLDTTAYLLRSLETWEKLGLRYDIVYVGYITGEEQARALCGVMDGFRRKGIPVIVDPILGDSGKKYQSVSASQVSGMKMLCAHADLITPNATEAQLLADALQGDARALASSLGAGSVLITSAQSPEGKDAVLGWDAQRGENFCLPFERVPGHHWGTGDLFTGLMIDGLLSAKTLCDAAKAAACRVAAQLRGEEKSLLPE